MAILLHIDTSNQDAILSLSKDNVLVGELKSTVAMQHASFVQPAIQQLMAEAGMQLQSLDAVSISNGPGSYTGLRVGLASAKGICFALDIPLISLSTLAIMADAMLEDSANTDAAAFVCPMIDARRMEVYTAIYDRGGNSIVQPAAVVLSEQFAATSLAVAPIIFSGSGAGKWQVICQHPHAIFKPMPNTTQSQINLAYRAYQHKKWADLVSAEPFYLKAFYSPGVI